MADNNNFERKLQKAKRDFCKEVRSIINTASVNYDSDPKLTQAINKFYKQFSADERMANSLRLTNELNGIVIDGLKLFGDIMRKTYTPPTYGKPNVI